jgi:cyclophilin family peptidyl-prolyl cis-trans isomerase
MEPGRPLAKLPPEQREGFYNTPPAITIDQNKTYQATIESAKGKIVIELNAQAAPVAVNNFVVLANLGFYDNMPVAFMASSEDGQRLMYAIFGSPANSPESDIGYVLMPEPLPGGNRVITGTVSMYPLFDADTGDLLGASGSQFFISFVEEADVQVPLSIIGKVVSGLEVAMKLETGDMVTSITIGE